MEKILAYLKNKNIYGLYLPMISDPKTGRSSVSLTLVFISFNLCIISMIGKWSGYFGGIDIGQSLNLFMVCAGLYWGRKMQSDNKGKVEISEENKNG